MTAISIENVSKKYRLGSIGSGLLFRDLQSWWARTRGKEDPNTKLEQSNVTSEADFWALKNVSLEIQAGDRVGIIGKNGAGKSTLLKILSSVTTPTSGTIRIKGRIASLLEVGTGFHPELTGRENIFLNGAILGMRRSEVQNKLDAIVDFAGVEKFLDTPVKRYSSGMYVRLAFAVAAHLEPEILVVDEVLAVGDVEFQKKCLGKMEDVSRNDGRTVLFVSHNLGAIRTLCNKGAFLNKGHLERSGNIDEIIPYYNNMIHHNYSLEWTGDIGDENLHLKKTWIRSLDADSLLDTASAIEIGITIDIYRPVDGLVLGFVLYSHHGYELARVLYDDNQPPPALTVQPQELTKTFIIPANTLAQGYYRIVFDVGLHMRKRIVDEEGALSFRLENIRGLGRRFLVGEHRGGGGLFKPDWTVAQ